jgi:hypothetical protein
MMEGGKILSPKQSELHGWCNGESVCLEYNRSWVQAHGWLKPKAIYVMVRMPSSSTTDHGFKPTVG